MKKIYSFLSLAIALFGFAGTAMAESVEFGYEPNDNWGMFDTPVLITSAEEITKDGVTFSMGDLKYEAERDMGLFYETFKRMGYWVGKKTDAAYMSWSATGKKVTIESIEFKGRCWGNDHSAEYAIGDGALNAFMANKSFDFGTWHTVTIENVGDASSIRFKVGGGDMQITYCKINYTVVDHSAVIEENGSTVTFAGEWTADEINSVIESGEYDNGELEGGWLGLVDLTDVALADLGSIETPNPNTIIAINRNQSINNEANVLVGGNVANLVITDPLTVAGAQDAANYSEVDCGFYYSGEEFTATQASYSRPMSATYATVMIPFIFDPAAQDVTIMDVAEITEAGVEVEPTVYAEIAFGRPFIAKVAGDELVITAENTTVAGSYGGINSMFGVYTEITLGEGDYFIAQDQFWNAGQRQGGVTLKPYRCYFELSSSDASNAAKLAIIEKESTAIKNAQIASEEVPAYNLQGIRVAANAKGFVVKGGKKFFNK